MDSLVAGGNGEWIIVGFPVNGVVNGDNANQVLIEHAAGSSDKFLQLRKEKDGDDWNQYVDMGRVTHGTCSMDFDLCETGTF